ncbi:response regulator [Chitinophagaceae bacterium MMS25-I14]
MNSGTDEPKPKNIFLADDDADDRVLFEDALKEICKKTTLTTAIDGTELMEMLHRIPSPLPDVIFLDLNMPRKNGFECLDEIKGDPKLHKIPVIIFSTAAQPNAVSAAYNKGASYYMCKPGTFPLLVSAIKRVLSINWELHKLQPAKEDFVLS